MALNRGLFCRNDLARALFNISLDQIGQMHEMAGDRYRALAADAKDSADQMKDPDARRTMRKIAEGYVRLARSADDWERTLPPGLAKAKRGAD